jgi:hypothetical protein
MHEHEYPTHFNLWKPFYYFTPNFSICLQINNGLNFFNNMQFRSLNILPNFMQVLDSIRKHYTKNEYFPKHILFSTISLLQEQKLNPRNYSKKEIIKSNFV